MHILTRYENNNGSTENCLKASKDVLDTRVVDFVDIAMDQCAPHHYKVESIERIRKKSPILNPRKKRT